MVLIGHGVVEVVVGWETKTRGGVVKSVGVVMLGEGNIRVARCWRWGVEGTFGEGR